MRANIAHARHLPDTYWWYALRDGGMKTWVLPIDRGSDKSPWELFTDKKPSGRYLKPFGCLCYYKIYEPRTKVMMRARRAVMLGRPDDQPGYLLRCLETDVIKVTPHVRFCVDQRPGLSRTPRVGEPAPDVAWPTFSKSGDHANPEVSPDVDDVQPPVDGTPDVGGEIAILDDRAADSGIGAVGEGDAGGDDDDDEGPPASHINRLRRPAAQTRFDFATGRYSANAAATAALTVITMLAAAIPQVGGFYINLGSGAPREGDVTSHLRQLGSHPIVLVDLHVGGYDDDLRDPHVAQAIESAARDPRCQGVLVSIPCKTWSAARSRVDPDLPHSLAPPHATRASWIHARRRNVACRRGWS